MKKLVSEVMKFYAEHGRRSLPWRKTRDPYKILVSELMLQQTQVERVLPKYLQFLETFPTLEGIANAPLSQVLELWQGLGYNRRAKFLHQAAKHIGPTYVLPKTVEGLQALPGVGPYTARAVATFAYNQPQVFIETNIRTVFTHLCFAGKETVSDSELLPRIEQALGEAQKQGVMPREWGAALMDYGSHLKRSGVRINAKSKHYTKQKQFAGSDRQVRGAILRELIEKKEVSIFSCAEQLKRTNADMARLLSSLKQEGLIEKKGRKYMLAK